MGQGIASNGKPSNGKQQDRVADLSDLLASLYYEARREYQIDLSHRAIRLLQLIAYASTPPRIDDIAKFMGCAASTASEHIKRLEKKGLLARQRSDHDERVVRVKLTEEGRTALVEHTSLDPEKLGKGLSALPVREQRELLRLLRAMTDRLTAR